MATEITVGTGGGNKTLTEMYIGTSGGNRAVTEAWVGTSGGNKQVFAATPSLDAASLTGWSNIAISGGTTIGTNEDRTITWSVGGARTIQTDPGDANVSYRINSGSYTTYTAPFSLSSGQTLGWRFIRDGTDPQGGTLTVTDATRGSALDEFSFGYTP